MTKIHSTSFLYATGHIRYNMTNDYMFRYILQKNKNVLKGLVCSLLHLHPEDVMPAIHIGFLDFTLFPEVPEFYATNMLMNVKNHHIFSDKLRLSVVDLSQIELATEEDRAAGIDHWARLFKVKTWREMIELAKKDECFQEAAQSLYEANADEIVRQKCWAREEAERHERTMQRDMGLLKDKIESMRGEYAFLKDEHDTLKNENNTLKDENDTLKEQLLALQEQIRLLKKEV